MGGITDFLGLTNFEAEEDARDAALAQGQQSLAMSKEQIELMKEQLEFQKDQYNDWKAIYGDIQTNLGDYYKNLNADDITTMGLQNQQREYQAAVKLVEADAAARGVTGGAEFATKSALTFQNAEARAKIRTDADKNVADQKLGFLGVGLGQGTAMLGTINAAAGNVNNAYSTGVNATAAMSGNFLQQQTQFGINNNSVMNDLFGFGTGFMMG